MDIPNTSDVSSEERNPDFHPNFKSSSPFRMLIRLIFKNLTTLYKLKLNKRGLASACGVESLQPLMLTIKEEKAGDVAYRQFMKALAYYATENDSTLTL